jgi:hypothetical protein
MSELIHFVSDNGAQIPLPTLTAQTRTYYLVEALNNNCPFTTRDGVQLVSYEGELRLLGGWNTFETPLTKKDDWKSANGITWTQNPTPIWNLPRHRFIAKVYNNKIWVMLNDPYNSTDKSMYTYDSTNGWASIGQLGITDNQNLYFHFLHTDSTNKQWIYFGGGQTDLAVPPTKFNNYLHRWDGTTLEKVCDFPIGMGNRSNSVSWSYNNKIYIAGGGNYMNNGAHTYNNDIWVSEDDGITFTLLGINNLFAKQYGDIEVWDGKIWYLDGNTIAVGGNGNVKGLYSGTDPLNMTLVNGWGFIPARHATGICVHNNALHIVAGNMWNDSYRVAKYII